MIHGLFRASHSHNHHKNQSKGGFEEWPSIAEENGFLYISLNHYESMTDSEIVEDIEYVVENHPMIDTLILQDST